MKAKVFENARRPAYQLEVDFGEEIGIKKSSAQITEVYQSEELIGKQVLAVINFLSRQIMRTSWMDNIKIFRRD